MAVASEFLLRGWNVAVPEVDVGDDAFVIRDSDFKAARIQVKAGNLRGSRVRSTTFRIPLAQLRTPTVPELYYVLAARSALRWEDFVVIKRPTLGELHVNEGLGDRVGPLGGVPDSLLLRLTYRDDGVRCGSIDLSAFRNDWSPWPIVKH